MNARLEILLRNMCGIANEKRESLTRFYQGTSIVLRQFLIQINFILIQDRLLSSNRFQIIVRDNDVICTTIDLRSKCVRSFVEIDQEDRPNSLTSESLVYSLSVVLVVTQSEHSPSDSLLAAVERLG